VLATHNADEALGFCDRVMVLNRGRALAIGTPRELAARFGEERYRILTTQADHHCFRQLEDRGALRRLPSQVRAVGIWQTVECAIPGDPSSSADILRVLVESGASVSRLERVEPSLAELISRIIISSATEGGDA
jgi:ABC-2 type transport system ATP-binding protein